MWYFRAGKILRKGTRVRLWPGDTYAKYGVVRKADRLVTIEITHVETGEPYYRAGDLVTLPWTHILVISDGR